MSLEISRLETAAKQAGPSRMKNRARIRTRFFVVNLGVSVARSVSTECAATGQVGPHAREQSRTARALRCVAGSRSPLRKRQHAAGLAGIDAAKPASACGKLRTRTCRTRRDP